MITCDWRRIGRAKLGEGVIKISARSGAVEEADISSVGTAAEDRFVGCTPAEALTLKAAVGAVPLTGTLAEGTLDDGTLGAEGAGVYKAAGGTLAKGTPADGTMAVDRLMEGTLAEVTLDEGRTGGKSTEGKSSGSRKIGDGMKGEGGCAEGSTVGVITVVVVPDPGPETGTVSGGALGGAAMFAGVAATWRPGRPCRSPLARRTCRKSPGLGRANTKVTRASTTSQNIGRCLEQGIASSRRIEGDGRQNCMRFEF